MTLPKILLSAMVVVIATTSALQAAKNPSDKKADRDAARVLMNVAGNDVTLGEFEYLYNKNRAQQLEPQTLDQYVDMFVNFKLKVADAVASGLDTTQSFRTEFEQFRADLAKPYLTDSTVLERLVQEQYGRMGQEVNVAHIMMPAQTPAQREQSTAILDSLRAEILAGRADLDSLAVQYSIDPAVRQRHNGQMGWIPAGRFPYAFEEAAWTTEVGDISPIINSGFGLHILRVNGRRPSQGEVSARHILRMTQGLDDAGQAAAKVTIDSIYAALTATPPADFGQLATTLSQDPGSAKRGGDLGWFSSGMMVQPFDSIAFALADGEISQPFATPFGYHIVQRLGHRGIPELDSIRPNIVRSMSRDQRATMPRTSRIAELRQRYNASINETAMDAARQALLLSEGRLDSVTIAALSAPELVAFTVAGIPTSLYDVLGATPMPANGNGVDAATTLENIRRAANDLMDAKVAETYTADLPTLSTDYRNLLNEYRDGILLFDASNANVWERASKDREGLEAFFKANSADYSWDSPRFKAMVVFATTDSVADLARKALEDMDSQLASIPDSVNRALHQAFGRNIKVERVVAPKGMNAITDFLAYGGEKPTNTGRWGAFFAWKGRMIESPETANDVLGPVTTDYQTLLDKQWIEALRAKYPVKIDKKVLKKVK